MKYRGLPSSYGGTAALPGLAKVTTNYGSCPCGQHKAVVTKPGEVSPGVAGDLIKKLACLPEGWLQ